MERWAELMLRPTRMLLGAGAFALGGLAVAIIASSSGSGEPAPPGTTVLASEQVRPWSCPAGTPLTATCAYVVSAIDPAVQLFVVRVDTEGATGVPLLVLGDGPTDAPSDRLRELVPLGRELGRDLIVVDPPGSGRSKPSLGCPELDTDPARPSLSDTQLNEALAACHDRLEGAGVDLAMVTTTATSDRIEDVRRALGVETWSVLVGLENSRLGLELARRSGPAVMEALVIESPLAGEYNPFVDASTPAVTALVEACEADAECRAAHGDLEATLGSAVAELEDNPFVLALSSGSTARAQRVLPSDALIGLGSVISDDDDRPSVPRVIATSVAEGDWSVVAQAMSRDRLDTTSIGALVGRRCAEDAPRVEDGVQEFLRQNALGWSAHFTGLGAVEICTVWQMAEVTDPVASSTGVDVPLLIVRGQFDPVSRLDDVEALSTAIDGAVVVNLTGTGGSTLESDCARRIMANFLMTPATAPDVTCADSNQPTWVS